MKWKYRQWSSHWTTKVMLHIINAFLYLSNIPFCVSSVNIWFLLRHLIRLLEFFQCAITTQCEMIQKKKRKPDDEVEPSCYIWCFRNMNIICHCIKKLLWEDVLSSDCMLWINTKDLKCKERDLAWLKIIFCWQEVNSKVK